MQYLVHRYLCYCGNLPCTSLDRDINWDNEAWGGAGEDWVIAGTRNDWLLNVDWIHI